MTAFHKYIYIKIAWRSLQSSVTSAIWRTCQALVFIWSNTAN